ncbi:regulatory protein GemA [Bartonella sp. CB60]|uniref:regulatory protein GemA n=1 Tax=Bartonella sp. CB60 TaxID=3113619 RepID=UPI00300DD99A
MSFAVLHMGKQALGLDDATYRAMLFRLTGKRSAKDLSPSDYRLVVDEMKAKGFQPHVKLLEGKYAKKLQALWIAGWNLGIVRDRSDKALIAFVKRQTGIDHIRFLRDSADAAKAIEALKSWLSRDGGVDWTQKGIQYSWQKMFGYPILCAQWRRLNPKVEFDLEVFYRVVMALSDKPLETMNLHDFMKVMNGWGREIRKSSSNKE